MNAQHLKIICRDNASSDDLGAVANAERSSRDLAYEKRVKQFAVSLEFEEIRPGKTSMAGFPASSSREGH